VRQQGETYAAFIESELKREHDRRSALDARAIALSTTSSALLTLVFAITVIVTGKEYQFSSAGARGLLLSLALFVVAAVLGLIANVSRKYQVADRDTLREMTNGHWTDTEVDARNICAGLSVTTIATLRCGNDFKDDLIRVAFGLQITAILGLVVTVGWELRTTIF